MLQVMSFDVIDLPLVLSLASPVILPSSPTIHPCSLSLPSWDPCLECRTLPHPIWPNYPWCCYQTRPKPWVCLLPVPMPHTLPSTLYLSHLGLHKQTPLLSCPQALSACALHCTKGQGVHPPREQVWVQIRHFVCVWRRATSTPDTRPCACCTVLPVLSDSSIPREMFFSLAAFSQWGHTIYLCSLRQNLIF